MQAPSVLDTKHWPLNQHNRAHAQLLFSATSSDVACNTAAFKVHLATGVECSLQYRLQQILFSKTNKLHSFLTTTHTNLSPSDPLRTALRELKAVLKEHTLVGFSTIPHTCVSQCLNPKHHMAVDILQEDALCYLRLKRHVLCASPENGPGCLEAMAERNSGAAVENLPQIMTGSLQRTA